MPAGLYLHQLYDLLLNKIQLCRQRRNLTLLPGEHVGQLQNGILLKREPGL